MTKKMIDKRQKPKLSTEHELLRTTDVWKREGFVDKARFEGGVMLGADGERVSFDDCLFKDVSFSGSDYSAAEFVDVRFDTCDFSNVNFQNATFHRCEILNSKLTGADFANANIGHTLFTEIDGRYSNFSYSGMKEIEFADCNLSDAEFYECRFKPVRFRNCKMDNINFTETELSGVDLSSNTYDRIEVTLPKIAGCIVSKEQAIGFARVLGLSVNEE